MDSFVARFSKSVLAVNEGLRRSPIVTVGDTAIQTPTVPDAWADLILQARIFLEHTEGRTLILFHLIQDIAPELVSRATALRYVRQMERKNLITIDDDGRYQIVRPTEAFLEAWRFRIRAIRSILDGFGIVDRPPHGEIFVLHLSADGIIRDAWHTEALLGREPAQLAGKGVECLLIYAAEDTRELLEEVWSRTSRGEFVRMPVSLLTRAGKILETELRAIIERTSTGTDILRAEFLVLPGAA